MAKVYDERGELAPAELWYRRALDAGPHAAQPHIYLGGFLARRGRLEEAEDVHRRGTGCSHGPVDEAWLNLGLVLRAQERFNEALKCFEAALRLDPDYGKAATAAEDVRRVLELMAERKAR
ncbi:MAG TPA: tetratricopeptide repeat protein, partial [Planctomycetaceae bacterium]|nr:tetratricopeptide repeat protein [Planctomycetaceae bacterium]